MAKGLCLVKAEGEKEIKAQMDVRDCRKEAEHPGGLWSLLVLFMLIYSRPLLTSKCSREPLPILELQELRSTKGHQPSVTQLASHRAQPRILSGLSFRGTRKEPGGQSQEEGKNYMGAWGGEGHRKRFMLLPQLLLR